MRKTITVLAEIPELGIRKTFTLEVRADGRLHSQVPNCYVVGTAELPLIGVEIGASRQRLIEFHEDARLQAFHEAVRDELADD